MRWWRAFLDGLSAWPEVTLDPSRVSAASFKTPDDAIADDWRKVGEDMRRLTTPQHGEKR